MNMEEKEERNELQDRIENEVITRSFQVSGMPIAVFNEVDQFCKDQFGDNRWTMIHTLVKAQQEDYKFAMIYDKLEDMEVKINNLYNNPQETEKKPKTFGKVI
jgi:hypothetical protein